jgi:hypothetical protein
VTPEDQEMHYYDAHGHYYDCIRTTPDSIRKFSISEDDQYRLESEEVIDLPDNNRDHYLVSIQEDVDAENALTNTYQSKSPASTEH